MKDEKVIVSACLVGIQCRYDGADNVFEPVREMYIKNLAIPACPEQLGGMPTPRRPSEIIYGEGPDVINGDARLVNSGGRDVTEKFIIGAQKTLQIAKKYNIKTAIFKEGSPSCGVNRIKDGTFTKTDRKGCGVTTALLRNNNIKVVSDEEIKNGRM